MSKDISPHPAEWRTLIETILLKASSDAYAELRLRIKTMPQPKPSKSEFIEHVITYSHSRNYVSVEEKRIEKQFGKGKAGEFLHSFRLAEEHLKRGEDKDLEAKIMQWLDKLAECGNCINAVDIEAAKYRFDINDGKHSIKKVFCSQECKDKYADRFGFKLEE